MTTETKQPAKDNKKKDQAKEEDLSLEDRELKEKIDGHCENLLQNNQPSLTELTEIVKSATRTMTSVPRPFKFLKTHYKLLTTHFASLPDGAHKVKRFLISDRVCQLFVSSLNDLRWKGSQNKSLLSFTRR